MFECFLTRILQRKALRKVVHPHNGVYIPLESARRIGFVANADNPGSVKAVGTITMEMQKRRMEFMGIYLDFRKNPGEEQASISNPSVRTVRRNDVNWYGLPYDNAIKDFVQNHFDILIDLTQDKRVFAADYILAKADASFRIGVSNGSKNPYDMIVSSPDGQQTGNPDQLVKSILLYLTTIHTDSK